MVFLNIATSLPVLLDQNKKKIKLFCFLYCSVIKQFTEGKHEISLRKIPPPPPPPQKIIILILHPTCELLKKTQTLSSKPKHNRVAFTFVL